MLIDVDGSKIDLITKHPMEKAQSANLDLVQVSPTGTDPTVCKLMDYGKHIFTKRKMFLYPK